MAAIATRRTALRATLARRGQEDVSAFAALVATALTFLSNGVAGVYVARRLGPALYGHVAYVLGAFGVVTLLGSLGLATRVVSAAAGRSNVASPGPSVAPPSLDRRESERRPVYLRWWRLGGMMPRGERSVDRPWAGGGQPTDADARATDATVELLALARLATLLPIGLAGVAALLHGDALAVACATGSVALARSFLAAAIAGSGRVALAAGVESLQGVSYLALLVVSRPDTPSGVYVAMICSHVLPLPIFVAVAAWSGLLDVRRIHARLWRRQALAAFESLGGIYALTVMIAVQGPWTTFVLGKSGHLAETAYLNVGLSLSGLVSSVCLSVHANLYFPRLCRLLESRGEEAARRYARTWFRSFFAAGLASAIALSVFPAAVLRALYSPSYQAATAPVAVVAWIGLVALLQQTLAWNLIARGDVAGPLLPAAAQCMIVVAGGAAAGAWGVDPLRAVLAAYLGGASAGWLLMAGAVRRRWPRSTPLGATHAVAALALTCALAARLAPSPALSAAALLPVPAALALAARRGPEG